MVIDVNYLIDIDWHWSIDDQSIVTKSYSQFYRLLSIFIDIDAQLYIFRMYTCIWSVLWPIIVRWKLNLIHCYWIPFTFKFVTTLKYVLIKLRRYLFDCMHINGKFFHQWKLTINRWSIDESHSKRSHRLFIDFQYQSIDKYRLVLIDIDTHRLSISSIKYAGIKCIWSKASVLAFVQMHLSQ
jgi:hypothetical protein